MGATEQARAYLQQGRSAEAEALLRGVIGAEPRDAQARHLLGLIRLQTGDAEGARRQVEAALEVEPENAEMLGHLTEIARKLGDLPAAIAAGRRAVELDPTRAPSLNNLGLALQDAGEIEAAEVEYRRSIAVAPEYPRAHYNLGNLLRERLDLEGAESALRAALRLNPRYPKALNALGVVLGSLGQFDESEATFRRAFELSPRDPKPLLNFGNLLSDNGRHRSAHRAYEHALKIRPEYLEALFAQASLLQKEERYREALQVLQRADAIDRDSAEVALRVAQVHFSGHAYPAAIAAFERSLRLDPDQQAAICGLAQVRGEVAQWADRDADLTSVRNAVAAAAEAEEPFPIPPFVAFLPLGPEELLVLAQGAAEGHCREAERDRLALGAVTRRERRRRLRVGYLSGDFRNHAVSHMSRTLYGLHDRDRFEICAYSFGPDDGSDYRAGIAADCDRFVELRRSSDQAAAKQIRQDGVDILVDLTGFTRGGRPGIVARRPAPIQVSWMYPAPTGGRLHDYILTDRRVTPLEDAKFFGEKLVLLPHCYHVTDYRQPISDAQPTRASQGLPEEGFVFCSFNKVAKVSPEIFDVWMRVLQAVPRSVLWLLDGPGLENLRRQAASRGVDPARLRPRSFAETKADHLARHALADLFFDTLVFNGHTTTADALWSGVPVLTRPGETFASRVAGSMLAAIGLPELVVPDLVAYESRAIELAKDPELASGLRRKLAQQRTTFPLFDTPRFTKNLERAFDQMWSRYEAGAQFDHLVVEEL